MFGDAITCKPDVVVIGRASADVMVLAGRVETHSNRELVLNKDSVSSKGMLGDRTLTCNLQELFLPSQEGLKSYDNFSMAHSAL